MFTQIGTGSVGKIAKKDSLMECDFVNSALKIQCHIAKNTLIQTGFSAILPRLAQDTKTMFLDAAMTSF